MQRLRKRPRIDTLASQQRAGSAAWGQRIYLSLLAILFLSLLDYGFGDAVFLRAEGIVLANKHVVAATYQGRVVDVRAREGQAVDKGDVLVQLESAEMLKEIADLSSRNADLASKTSQLRLKLATIGTVLPLADRHAKESTAALQKLDSIAGQGLVAAYRLDQALGSEFDTTSRLADLRGQSKLLGEEIALVESSYKQARHALNQFEAFYDQGLVKSVTAGVIGPRVPAVGQVVKFGDELMHVYGSNAYVLAYLPDRHFFAVVAGQEVEIAVGIARTRGRIEAVLAVADALPPEFQNMFRPRDRSRLLRVTLDDSSVIAISQKVRVTSCGVACWAAPYLTGALAQLNALARGIGGTAAGATSTREAGIPLDAELPGDADGFYQE
jgi:multidrug resistance efflux pump